MGGARAFPGVRLLAHPSFKLGFWGRGPNSTNGRKKSGFCSAAAPLSEGHSLVASSPDLSAQLSSGSFLPVHRPPWPPC